jgi:lipoprotein signal peptidase
MDQPGHVFLSHGQIRGCVCTCRLTRACISPSRTNQRMCLHLQTNQGTCFSSQTNQRLCLHLQTIHPWGTCVPPRQIRGCVCTCRPIRVFVSPSQTKQGLCLHLQTNQGTCFSLTDQSEVVFAPAN